jgi:hypothetical protein
MKNQILNIKTNSNSPYLSFLLVIEETEKAIKVQNTEYKNKIGWLPKKSLQIAEDLPSYKTYTFANWFRNINNGDSIKNAFKLL